MPRVSYLFTDDDIARLKRVQAKYGSGQIQAIRLGLILLDENPVLQVKLPPRLKPGRKSKARNATPKG